MKFESAILLSGLLSGEVSAQMYKKVKLKDVDVLTLYQGKMTNGRRSSPIPQLQVITTKVPQTGSIPGHPLSPFQCRGGSAGCSAFVPDVVQCYNRGSDGLEIQWECKTEMPMEYKFGKVQVSCEGKCFYLRRLPRLPCSPVEIPPTQTRSLAIGYGLKMVNGRMCVGGDSSHGLF